MDKYRKTVFLNEGMFSKKNKKADKISIKKFIEKDLDDYISILKSLLKEKDRKNVDISNETFKELINELEKLHGRDLTLKELIIEEIRENLGYRDEYMLSMELFTDGTSNHKKEREKVYDYWYKEIFPDLDKVFDRNNKNSNISLEYTVDKRDMAVFLDYKNKIVS